MNDIRYILRMILSLLITGFIVFIVIKLLFIWGNSDQACAIM